MVLSEKPINSAALERCLTKAWGLRKPALFRHFEGNGITVQLSSQGDWNHVMDNGPEKYEYYGVVLKETEGGVRPSEMIFPSMPIWAQFIDLPPNLMNKKYGELFGGWLGKVLKVDADEDEAAWGDVLRAKVEILIEQPLVRYIFPKQKVEDAVGVWWGLVRCQI